MFKSNDDSELSSVAYSLTRDTVRDMYGGKIIFSNMDAEKDYVHVDNILFQIFLRLQNYQMKK